jgi:anti-anti-sigma regulatory factor
MYERIRSSGQNLKFLILDLSASPYVDVAGSKMLLNLAEELHKKGTRIRIVQALSGVRDILRKQGIEEITGHISRDKTIAEALSEFDIIAQDFDPRL